MLKALAQVQLRRLLCSQTFRLRAGLQVPGAPTAAASSTAAGVPLSSSLPDPASTYAATPMPATGMAHTMPGPTQSEGPSVSGTISHAGVPLDGAQAAAAAPQAHLVGSADHAGGPTAGVPHLKEQ